jgi:hypothetical protein
MSYDGHVNLALEGTPFVVDASFMSAQSEWRESGKYGPQQQPEGLTALIGSCAIQLAEYLSGRDKQRFVEGFFSLFPNNPQLLRKLTGTKSHQDRKPFLDRALLQNQNNPESHILKGEALIDGMDLRNAMESWKQALRLMKTQRQHPFSTDASDFIFSSAPTMMLAAARLIQGADSTHAAIAFCHEMMKASDAEFQAYAGIALAHLYQAAGQRALSQQMINKLKTDNRLTSQVIARYNAIPLAIRGFSIFEVLD